MKKTKKQQPLKYVKPRMYHQVVDEIERCIEMVVNDDRNIDRVFFEDKIKFSQVILNDYSIQRSPKETDKKIVESSSIFLICNLILQVI